MFFLLKSNINPFGYCTKLRSSTSIFSLTRWCPQTWLAGKYSKNSGVHGKNHPYPLVMTNIVIENGDL